LKISGNSSKRGIGGKLSFPNWAGTSDDGEEGVKEERRRGGGGGGGGGAEEGEEAIDWRSWCSTDELIKRMALSNPFLKIVSRGFFSCD